MFHCYSNVFVYVYNVCRLLILHALYKHEQVAVTMERSWLFSPLLVCFIYITEREGETETERDRERYDIYSIYIVMQRGKIN